MQQLVKPAEYAKMQGMSRQSVYAKIKRGTLPSRKIDGRYYVIVASDESIDLESDTERKEEPDRSEKERIEQVSLIHELREVLKAKDETIEVLKTSIEDLKEANAQITQTLQQEITLLKQAFYEMKNIYQAGRELTHATEYRTREAEEEPKEAETVSTEEKTIFEEEPVSKKVKKSAANEEECWIPLGDLIQRQHFNYNKAKQIVKRFKKAYKKGDKRVKKRNGIYYISCYDFYEDILD
ncbi:DUF3972 domain-containing protein [Hydrogenimonas sp.]